MTGLIVSKTMTGYALAQGGAELARLSAEDVLALANSAAIYRQEILDRLPKGAVYATPISSVHVQADALGQEVLMEVRTSLSDHAVFQLDYSQGLDLLRQLMDLREPEIPSSSH